MTIITAELNVKILNVQLDSGASIHLDQSRVVGRKRRVVRGVIWRLHYAIGASGRLGGGNTIIARGGLVPDGGHSSDSLSQNSDIVAAGSVTGGPPILGQDDVGAGPVVDPGAATERGHLSCVRSHPTNLLCFH